MSIETDRQIVDIDTLVRAVLNTSTAADREDEMIRKAHGTLYWLECSGVALMCDGQLWSTAGRNHYGMGRLIRKRGLTEPVDTTGLLESS